MQQHINTLEEINLIYRAQRITLDGLRLLDSIERNGSFSKAARTGAIQGAKPRWLD